MAKKIIKKRGGKLRQVWDWAVNYMAKEGDWSAEDDETAQTEIALAAVSEFKRLVDKLKETEKKAKEAEKESD